MDLEETEFSETCICGRTFSQHGPYNYHRRLCKTGNKRLSSALAKAKEIWSSRKRRRIHETSQGENHWSPTAEQSADLVVMVRQV